MQWKFAIAAAATAVLLAPSMAAADSVGDVENARAKERQGRWLNGRDREELRRWGGNDDWGRYSYGPYAHDGSYGSYGYAPGYRYYRTPY